MKAMTQDDWRLRILGGAVDYANDVASLHRRKPDAAAEGTLELVSHTLVSWWIDQGFSKAEIVAAFESAARSPELELEGWLRDRGSSFRESEAIFRSIGGQRIEGFYGLGSMAAVVGIGFALLTFVLVLTGAPAKPFAITAALLVASGWAFAAAMNALMRARFVGQLVKGGAKADAARQAWREFRAVED